MRLNVKVYLIEEPSILLQHVSTRLEAGFTDNSLHERETDPITVAVISFTVFCSLGLVTI